MKSYKQIIINEAKDWLIIALGITIYAVGFTIFILPHEIVIGGMAGFSTLIYYASHQTIPVAVAMYGCNLLLLLAGWRVLGKGFVIRTIYGATLLSAEIAVLEGYFTSHPPIITSPAMSIIMGSVILGFGIGLYYSHHGTAGGTDIVAAIMSKKSTVSMGRVMLIVDVSIVALSFFLPFDGDLEARVQARAQTIIYGWMAILIYSLLADKYLAEGRQTVQYFIISEHWEEIASRISHELARGVTVWEGRGFWTGSKREIMLVWCRKHDTYAILRIINAVDNKAIVTTSYVRSVYGNGFDALKVKKEHKKQQEVAD